jgi:hypothetical protein
MSAENRADRKLKKGLRKSFPEWFKGGDQMAKCLSFKTGAEMVVVERAVDKNAFECIVDLITIKKPGKLTMRRPKLPEHTPFVVLENLPNDKVRVRVWAFPEPENHNPLGGD